MVKKRLYTCCLCEFKNESFAEFCEHTERVHKQDLHPCHDCGKSFIREYELSIHRRRHTGETPHVCNICKQKFMYRHQLYSHKESAHGISQSKRPRITAGSDETISNDDEQVKTGPVPDTDAPIALDPDGSSDIEMDIYTPAQVNLLFKQHEEAKKAREEQDKQLALALQQKERDRLNAYLDYLKQDEQKHKKIGFELLDELLDIYATQSQQQTPEAKHSEAQHALLDELNKRLTPEQQAGSYDELYARAVGGELDAETAVGQALLAIAEARGLLSEQELPSSPSSNDAKHDADLSGPRWDRARAVFAENGLRVGKNVKLDRLQCLMVIANLFELGEAEGQGVDIDPARERVLRIIYRADPTGLMINDNVLGNIAQRLRLRINYFRLDEQGTPMRVTTFVPTAQGYQEVPGSEQDVPWRGNVDGVRIVNVILDQAHFTPVWDAHAEWTGIYNDEDARQRGLNAARFLLNAILDRSHAASETKLKNDLALQQLVAGITQQENDGKENQTQVHVVSVGNIFIDIAMVARDEVLHFDRRYLPEPELGRRRLKKQVTEFILWGNAKKARGGHLSSSELQRESDRITAFKARAAADDQHLVTEAEELIDYFVKQAEMKDDDNTEETAAITQPKSKGRKRKSESDNPGITRPRQKKTTKINPLPYPGHGRFSQNQHYFLPGAYQDPMEGTGEGMSARTLFVCEQQDTPPMCKQVDDGILFTWTDETGKERRYRSYQPITGYNDNSIEIAEWVMLEQPTEPDSVNCQTRHGEVIGSSEKEDQTAAKHMVENGSPIDIAADPEPGEAFFIVGYILDSNKRKRKKNTDDDGYNHRAAAVIAKDGQDRITIEYDQGFNLYTIGHPETSFHARYNSNNRFPDPRLRVVTFPIQLRPPKDEEEKSAVPMEDTDGSGDNEEGQSGKRKRRSGNNSRRTQKRSRRSSSARGEEKSGDQKTKKKAAL